MKIYSVYMTYEENKTGLDILETINAMNLLHFVSLITLEELQKGTAMTEKARVLCQNLASSGSALQSM